MRPFEHVICPSGLQTLRSFSLWRMSRSGWFLDVRKVPTTDLSHSSCHRRHQPDNRAPGFQVFTHPGILPGTPDAPDARRRTAGRLWRGCVPISLNRWRTQARSHINLGHDGSPGDYTFRRIPLWPCPDQVVPYAPNVGEDEDVGLEQVCPKYKACP
jgi:hypothetical protein